MAIETADDVQRVLIDALWREGVAGVRTIAEDGGMPFDRGVAVTLKNGAEVRVTIHAPENDNE
jgi:hypothetical protein